MEMVRYIHLDAPRMKISHSHLTHRSFIGQVPFVVLALILVAWGLENQTTRPIDDLDSIKMTTSSKLKRIDFVGAVLLSTAIISFLLAVDLPSRGMLWTSPVVICLIIATLVLGTIFLLFEGKYAAEPIFPPRLLVLRDVATTYSTGCLQIAATMAVCECHVQECIRMLTASDAILSSPLLSSHRGGIKH
jgi:hypothetical protein